jgi:hypothetical protein
MLPLIICTFRWMHSLNLTKKNITQICISACPIILCLLLQAEFTINREICTVLIIKNFKCTKLLKEIIIIYTYNI